MALFGLTITRVNTVIDTNMAFMELGMQLERRRIMHDVEEWIDGEGREDLMDVINPKCSCDDCCD